jgi:hypothetical protein
MGLLAGHDKTPGMLVMAGTAITAPCPKKHCSKHR